MPARQPARSFFWCLGRNGLLTPLGMFGAYDNDASIMFMYATSAAHSGQLKFLVNLSIKISAVVKQVPGRDQAAMSKVAREAIPWSSGK